MIRVKAAFFSLTPPPPADDDGSYLKWHLLDHMPEQYQLPGIQYALRYIADASYRHDAIAAAGDLEQVGNLVNYLVGDPVQQTLDDFMELGGRLAENGRFPEVRPSLQLRMPALLSWHAAPQALISAEVVPFRPHRGVLLVVEEPATDDIAPWLRWLHTDHYPALLATPGIAGVWTYGSTATWNLSPALQGGPQYTTVIYLDADPLAVTKAAARVVEERWQSGAVRPLFAGPLKTMIHWGRVELTVDPAQTGRPPNGGTSGGSRLLRAPRTGPVLGLPMSTAPSLDHQALSALADLRGTKEGPCP